MTHSINDSTTDVTNEYIVETPIDPLEDVAVIMAELVSKIDSFAELGLDQARIIHRTRNKLKTKVRALLEALKSGDDAKKELESIKMGVPKVPSIFEASKIGETGSPHNVEEQLLFEAYMRGHCWMIGRWLPDSGYEDTSTRMLWVVWRDRAALSKGL